MFKKVSLKVKLIVLFLLIGLIPVVTISLIAYNSTSKQLKQDAFNQLGMFADLSRTQLVETINSKESALVVLAASRDVYQSLSILQEIGGDLADPRWLERLEILEEFAPTVQDEFGSTYLFLTSSDGVIVYCSLKDLIGVNFGDRDYVQGALAGRNTWSEIFYGSTNEPVIAVSVPVKDGGSSGKIIGTVSFILDQSIVAGAAHEGINELGQSANSYLINGDGVLLTSTASGEYTINDVLKQKIDSPAATMLASPIKSGNYDFYQRDEYKNYLGKNVLGALTVAKIGGHPMGFVVEVETAEVLSGVDVIRNLSITVAIICAVIIAIVAFAIAQTIVRPVKKVSDLTMKLAEGDFTAKSEVAGRDEIGQMAGNLNSTIYALRKTLKHVQESSQNVSHASDEISSGNQDLSQRTEEQASSLEEIASTIEEITSSLEASSVHSAEADNFAKKNLDIVYQGEKVVSDMKNAMNEITVGNQEIAEIIAKVNDIAFQTNLLALNAAVEAARAGEQGRGFAVVAAEVRNLAGHSAESAKEIEKLIKDSIVRVDKGNNLMNETEKVLQEVVENTKKAGDVIGEIASSLKEQSVAAGDIRAAIEELNQVTQQNASLVEEIASSSENMHSEAIDLADQVNFFKLTTNDKANGMSAVKKRTDKNKKVMLDKAVSVKEAIVTSAPEKSTLEFEEDDFEKF